MGTEVITFGNTHLIMKLRFSPSLFTLGCLAILACGRPASATTYIFSVPESTLLNAWVTFLGGSSSAQLYGAYDVYIRPIQSSDIGVGGITGPALSSYTINSAGSPIANNVNGDKWNADINQHANSGLDTFLSIHFYFDQNDSKISLITNNANVVGKSYTNPTTNVGTVIGRQMPGNSPFNMTITSTDPGITGTVNFLFYATAMQFTDTSANTVSAKSVVKGPIEFSLQGVNTPEPSTLGFALGGAALIAARLLRRRNTSR